MSWECSGFRWGRAGVCQLLVELGCFWLKLSGDLHSSQNPNEIQSLSSMHSSPVRCRDEGKYRVFLVTMAAGV